MNSAYITKLNRIERLQRRAIRGKSYLYTMPGGEQRIMSWQQSQKGFGDAVNRIPSIESRIVLNAVTDNNNGAMLRLLFAVLHPVNTDPT